MARFLIEVPHDADELACARVVQVFLASGSHFLTNAEWGCIDGDHKAWMVVEVDTKDEAKFIVPPAFRPQARIVRLGRFSLDQIDGIISRHTKGRTQGTETTAA